MYFFSNKYIQINNNTKTKIKVRMDMALLTFCLLSRFHLETNSFLLDLSKSESTSLSLENLDW